MAKSKTSIALTSRHLERFKAAASVRGVSLSEFLAQAAEQTLDTADATGTMKQFSTDLRADLSKVMTRLIESDALQAQERNRFLEEQKQVFSHFLDELLSRQVDAVKQAVRVGQGKPIGTSPVLPTFQDLGLHPSPPLKGS